MKREAHRIFFYCVAGLFLPAYLFAFHRYAQFGQVPSGFPSAEVSFPARFQGVLAGSPGEVRFIAEGSSIGTPVVLVAADGRRFESVVRKATTIVYDVLTFVDGLVFWAVAAFVFAPRASPGAPRDFFWATLLYGFAIMVGGVHYSAAWSSLALGIALMTCLSILPAIFFHVTLSFPRRHPILDKKPSIAAALAILVAGVAIAQGVAYVGYVRAPSPDTWRVFDTARRIVDALLVGLVAAGTVMLFAASRRLELSREKAQTKWLMWGIAVGVTPYVFLRALPRLFGVASPLDPAVDRLFELAVPLAFLGAIVQHQFLDIDIIIRRSLIYGVLAALMLALYVTLGVGIGGQLERGADHRWVLIPIAIGLGAGMMFSPLRRVIGRWVDRTLFKIDYEYERATALLRPKLENAAGQEALADLVSTCLRSYLRPITSAVVIRDRDRTIVVGNAAHEVVREIMNSRRHDDSRTAAAGNGTLAAPNSTSLPEIESADFPSELAANDFVLMEALARDGAVTGLILLGRRETQRRYVDADIALVRSVAAEAARAMERIHLVQVAAEESAARRHSEEMNRMRSDFLSRVAHDLRTPLTSISWSTANLQDGVAGPLTDRQVEYLRSIRSSSGYLSRLVSNLLDLSRLENVEAAPLGTRPVHMSDLLEDAMTALQPLAQEKNVRFRLVVAADTRAIVGDPDRLLEVALNLLDNALKYTPPETIIEVSLPATAGGCQAFTVRDRGPGFGDSNPAPLFERFRQGSSSPHSPQLGFGLGLYIVRSYLDLMGGRVAAQNHPEGGALLTCILPAAEERERERVTDR